MYVVCMYVCMYVVTSQCYLSPSNGSSSLAVLVVIQMVPPYSSGILFETKAKYKLKKKFRTKVTVRLMPLIVSFRLKNSVPSGTFVLKGECYLCLVYWKKLFLNSLHVLRAVEGANTEWRTANSIKNTSNQTTKKLTLTLLATYVK